MPWYKFTARHGPGHQSKHVSYRYFEKPLTRKERKEEWEDAVGGLNWPIGGVRRVKWLPVVVWHRKALLYQDMKEEAERMLKVLAETETFG